MMSKIGLLKYTKEHVVAVGIEASRTLHELSTPYQVLKITQAIVIVAASRLRDLS